LKYRLLKPAAYDPEKKYPLVLFLHGAGERGDDNKAQLKHGAKEFARADRREQFPAYVVFPQCPVGSRWVESPWDLASGRGEFARTPSTPMKATLELVDHLIATESVDPDRVYVTGLSMGGQGTWFAAAAKPKRFAAMLEVCGGGDPSWAEDYAGIPVWGFHGQADKVVPIGRGREMIVALAQGGHHPELRFTEYPGVGHDSWTRTYSRDDVFEWLFSQSK
ncbi:MAG: prolyl oligopeptidase family serine peptidase, partial [Rubripirellula sp.]